MGKNGAMQNAWVGDEVNAEGTIIFSEWIDNHGNIFRQPQSVQKGKKRNFKTGEVLQLKLGWAVYSMKIKTISLASCRIQKEKSQRTELIRLLKSFQVSPNWIEDLGFVKKQDGWPLEA